MRKLICERCNREFVCNKNGESCWCYTKPYVRLDVTESYKDCLCEKCLEELYETSKNNNPR